MPFLHSLIYKKIESAVIEQTKVREEKSKNTGEAIDVSQNDEMILETIPAEAMEGLSHSEKPSSSRTDDHQLKHVRICNPS